LQHLLWIFEKVSVLIALPGQRLSDQLRANF
jgi:hypothetical protein